jgi:hypothetical protein
VAAADVNGILDLAVGGLRRTRVLQGNSDGSFQTTTVSYGTGRASLAIADFNGDGLPDLAATDYGDAGSNNTFILINDGQCRQRTLGSHRGPDLAGTAASQVLFQALARRRHRTLMGLEKGIRPGRTIARCFLVGV